MVDPVRFPDIEYPETDGKPMPDGDYQGVFYRYAVQAVRDHFLPRSEVYVTGNLFIYLEEGNPKNRIAPDMYVVMNGGHRFRDTYKVWEEPGGIPDFVLEIVSPSTWCTDLGPKRDQYAALGVGEYWLHDPHANFMHPALAGYRLSGDAYEPISGIESPEGTLTMHSETLGLDLCLQGEKLRFFDPVRGEYLLDYAETLAKMHVAEHEAHAAQAALHAAKSEAHAARAETHAAESEAHAARGPNK
ncbi:MAG: Uma2 family endonuclease [Gammaproteobacteria bacterium]|nr:Uma2 family endonuclease [Gammaproteobacteria bacterium]